MTTRMLIDARHREETRVAVTKGNRIEEFDFESAEHKQLKGNIYLAKVTRVEPSLQAAFVEYGGNRHGFLAFSEIHPDYYQIPKEDRDALLREEAEHAAAAAQRAEEDLDELEGDVADVEYHDEDENGDAPAPETIGEDGDGDEDSDADNGDNDGEEGAEESAEGTGDGRGDRKRRGRDGRKGGRGRGRGRRGEDEDGESRMSLRRRYKIQDVIRRRQVMLVQVVKEERGNKGAALTTYLSLAGRYCVLMPNTMHGGGISRKISNGADRRKLKAMIDELALPPTMGCIVRTAGMSRTKVEIKRDFDYLARLWDEIRENTLGSSAPALIHSDSDLVKRAIRDIYHKDIEEVLVEGDEGYKAAKQFMKLLMPSHARRVKQYADPVSLYQRYGVEDQLAGMLNPVVQLKSGGYLVINPTEALVSIDINSGRSTREHNIEQTALSTNLEAAHEIARQLRLRDMAGLVVIDFIDMDHGSNVRKVERAMKDALKNDRARIQVGRISGFGLMEMSRQRLRTGVLEASTRPCPHCEGTGLVRTASSAGLSALRLIEEEAARGKGNKITLRASQEATFYLLNEKRRELREIEELYGVTVEILPDGETEGARMAVEVSGPPPIARRSFAPIAPIEDDDDDYPEDEEEEAEEEATEERPARSRDREEGARERDEGEGDGEGRKRRRRRRRGRRGRRDDEGNEIVEGGEGGDDRGDDIADSDAENGETAPAEAVEAAPEADAEEAEAKPRRRRGGRGRKKTDAVETTDDAAAEAEAAPVEVAEIAEPVAEEAPAAEEKPKRKRAPRKTKAALAAEAEAAEAAEAPVVEAPAAETPAEAEVEPAKPAPKKRASRAKKAIAAEAPAEPATAGEAEPVAADADGESEGPDGEPRRGWWQRTFGN
ncbi:MULTISPECIES: ribonuclease E/G [unclassified Sphingopyxis]|jgi:ribonuclease E|uniref:Rne/Rng family ribonuclease n=1 Tax=unclassified Sphingopyxis TaxID=2614943 RepID=UPI000AE97286|nr:MULTISPECIES: ribonuclease E/G [unclassified Sphingopyxis]USI77322.1 ribonuclease E/G [Sphingopyxis sp. USTB-05]